ncbi:MAG: Rieske 2Fe-2S domain-containing protein [Nitriliruptorales bacterium]|nr:Rieske 2Fe-2S domain-containing protein [Nitriliruptorales bacterium]
MKNMLKRRDVLSNSWKAALGLVAVAGIWTSWDVLRPRTTTGFGGLVKTLPRSAVPSDGVVAVRAAKGYLTEVDGEVIALSETCPHLGCRVPWCESSGQFECPCHGSFFSRAGDYLAGPTPRGMDRYPTEIQGETVMVDTGSLIEGPAPSAPKVIDEPARGPACTEGGGH